MAIVEEVSDDEAPVQVPSVRHAAAPSPTAKASPAPIREEVPINMEPVNQAELLATLRILSARLALPEDLLPRFLHEDTSDTAAMAYKNRARATLGNIKDLITQEGSGDFWQASSVEEQARFWSILGRMKGDDHWTDEGIRATIDALPMNKPEDVCLHILQHDIRPLFASHPSLSAASRALSRPSGGDSAMSDLHDAASQPFKSPAGWGVYNLLSFCASRLSDSGLLEHIGLVLPPTLVLMDDWEPAWRLRGIRVLGSWFHKIDPATLQRMGLGKLLYGSLIHTLSMHGAHEVPDGESLAVTTTMQLVWRLWRGQERMDKVEEIMEKGIIHGWMYSPSGEEGRVVGIKIARDLSVVTEFLGEGIVRWLKTIIPQLLQPLAFTPTPHNAAHIQANLTVLHAVLRAVEPTGRAARWRGVILDYTARLWFGLAERDKEDATFGPGQIGGRSQAGTGAWTAELKDSVVRVVQVLAHICPAIKEVELAQLGKIDATTFGPLISAV